MSVPEVIYKFLKSNHSKKYCTGCINIRLKTPGQPQVNQVCLAFGLTSDFIWEMGSCDHCKKNVLVI